MSGSLGWIFSLGAVLVPALTVNAAPLEHRVIWVLVFLPIFWMSGLMALADPKRPAEKPMGPYRARHHFRFVAFLAFSFGIAEIMAIILTYGVPGGGFVWQVTEVMAAIGAAVVPALGKYATAVEPPLATELLLRSQAIVSVFFLAGASGVIATLFYLLRMPTYERARFRRERRHATSDLVLLLGCVFAFWIAADGFIGWSDHWPDTGGRGSSMNCLMKPRCFPLSSDLVILGAALMKTFMLFGFPLGAFALVDSRKSGKCA